MAENIPLEQRAGRNIGIESLPVFIQAALAPEVVVTPSGSSAPGGTPATLMTAVKNAVRTPFTRGQFNGRVFNKGVDSVNLTVWLDDGEGNRFLIANGNFLGNDVDDLDLSNGGSNPFTISKPLCLCGKEKIVVQAYSGES